MTALVTLLHDDAVQSMPPYAFWLRGCRGHRHLDGAARAERLPGLAPDAGVAVNGSPGFAQYKPDPAGGYMPWALQVLEIKDDQIARMTFFLDTEAVFPSFDLPDHLPA